MTTEQEQQDLVDILKSGFNTYTVELTGYGGEIVLGTITEKQYRFWKDNDIDSHALDWDNEQSIPEELKICNDGSWHDCDDIAHENGVEFSDICWATVYDSNNQQVWQSRLGLGSLEAAGVDPEGINYDELYVNYNSTANYVFLGQSHEKGTFFTGEFETFGSFNPKKLSFSTIDVQGWQLVNGVSYESKIVDDTGGYDTVGKGMDFKVFAVER